MGFGEALAKGACPQRPVTEPKRSQNPKRPLLLHLHPCGYSISDNALSAVKKTVFSGFLQFFALFCARPQITQTRPLCKSGKLRSAEHRSARISWKLRSNAPRSDLRLPTSDFGLWTLDLGLWTLDCGPRTSDFRPPTSEWQSCPVVPSRAWSNLILSLFVL